jgi:uncharacterized protein
MEWPLALAGLALGVASTPHCAAMCGAPCAALTRGGRAAAGGFQLGRLVGYMAAGAIAAGGIAMLGAWSRAAPSLHPFWTLLHLAFLALGACWLATGRQPAWLLRGSGTAGAAADVRTGVPLRLPSRRAPTARASIAGLAWVAWPCATLQGGLLLAALANGPLGGALVMAAFALGSMPGLALVPWAWARWRSWHGTGAVGAGQGAQVGWRIAGAGLVVVSGWALTHGMRERFVAWCVAIAA